MGTVTVRFMCDELRAEDEGFPWDEDIQAVTDYLNIKRPVAVKDFFVESPIRQEISFTINDLVTDTEAIRAAIEQSVSDMLLVRAVAGQTIYASWVIEAISKRLAKITIRLIFENTPMLSPGHLAVLGIYCTMSDRHVRRAGRDYIERA